MMDTPIFGEGGAESAAKKPKVENDLDALKTVMMEMMTQQQTQFTQALAAQHALRVADGLPMVLCGDWNFKPGDASYRFMTTGELDTKDEAYPDYRAFDPWRIEQGKKAKWEGG